MTGPGAPHHPVPRDEPGLFAGAPGPDERMGDGPSDGGRIRLEDLDVNPYPSYRALRDEGVVWVDAVVLPDGSVGDVSVTKSLDSTFGLDQEAVKAARQWRFRPGTRFGEPVAVLVTIELTFTLR